MKTILVPIDYSAVSDNALQYAIELAGFSNARIVLAHVCGMKENSMLHSSQEIERDHRRRLRKLEQTILNSNPNVKIERVVRSGFITDGILDIISEKQPDVVVMGITGAGKKTPSFIGSNTTSLLQSTGTPVLVIPPNTRFKPVQRLVLAWDFSTEIPDATMQIFKRFVALFKAKVLILNVLKEKAIPYVQGDIEYELMEETHAPAFKGIDYKLYFPVGDDLTKEVNLFIETHKADMLVMVPRAYKLIAGFFHQSATKQIAFHTQVPLLSLH